MTIRWMGLYGLNRGIESIRFEINRPKCHTVSAEWTIRGRPFIAKATVGLLVKSKAELRRYRYDAYTTHMNGIRNKLVIPSVRKTSIKKEILNTNIWEAICLPEYVGIVVTEKQYINYYKYICKNLTLSFLFFVIKK